MLFKSGTWVIMSARKLLQDKKLLPGWVMAKRKVNKSQEIRDFVGEHPTASARDVVDALKKRGIKVSAPMVANVKSKAGLTRSKRGRPPGSGASRNGKTASNAGLALDALIEAKRFVAKVGSTQNAVDAIRALEKLDSIAS